MLLQNLACCEYIAVNQTGSEKTSKYIIDSRNEGEEASRTTRLNRKSLKTTICEQLQGQNFLHKKDKDDKGLEHIEDLEETL